MRPLNVQRNVYCRISFSVIAGIGILLCAVFAPVAAHAQGGPVSPNGLANSAYWPTYLYSKDHSGYNSKETTITASTAPNLKLHWSYTAGGSISDQPVEANGNVYWGSWDGNEHATSVNGSAVWSTNLGQTSDSSCLPPTVGVASTATIANVTFHKVSTPVVFVGGGNAQFYALNASTGAIIWHTSLGSSPSHFIWDSPVVYQGNVYIGTSSFGDCPLVQGQVFELNAKTGSVVHTFNIVPTGCTGGGMWGSPTIDTSAGTLYFVTGNNGSCSSSEPYTVSIVELHASDLSIVGSWAVPANQQGPDSDFGSTPTLFQATINGSTVKLVGVANKNGVFYAFKRDALNSGPIWQMQVANGGDCPQCGFGSISPAAWDGTHLYVAGGATTINGTSYKGSLRALNPANGQFIWQVGFSGGPVLGAVTAVPGVAFVTEGTSLVAVSTSSGQILKTLSDTSSGSLYYGAASVSQGIVYVGNMDKKLYAYGL